MNYGISIPRPCDENWDNMTPDALGRHCGQCCKTVIDFTDWQATDIAAYLQAQQHQSVCGRFTDSQLIKISIEPDVYIQGLQRSRLNYLMKIAAVCVFVFCLSSQADAQKPQHTAGAPVQVTLGKPARVEQGEVTPIPQSTTPKKDPRAMPAKQPDPVIMGMIAAPVKRDTVHIKGRVSNMPVRKK